MKTIAIYYIATDVYVRSFTDFLSSIHLFMPGYKKIIVLLTDALEIFDGYADTENNVYIDRRYINHYPWPIITLYKHYLIYSNKIDCDYAAYFNADIRYNMNIKFDENVFDLNKMNFSSHANYKYNESTIENTAFSFFHKNCKNSLFYEILENNKNNIYCQAAFFFGPNNLFFDMCYNIFKYVDMDLRTNYTMLRWHDESYMNVWIQNNINMCNIIPEFVSSIKPESTFIKTNMSKINK